VRNAVLDRAGTNAPMAPASPECSNLRRLLCSGRWMDSRLSRRVMQSRAIPRPGVGVKCVDMFSNAERTARVPCERAAAESAELRRSLSGTGARSTEGAMRSLGGPLTSVSRRLADARKAAWREGLAVLRPDQRSAARGMARTEYRPRLAADGSVE